MDLSKALKDVLDNPEEVWNTVVESLAPMPRAALMTLVLTGTPQDLTYWRSVMARRHPDSALSFESIVKILDDTFIQLGRSRSNLFAFSPMRVAFRNPGVEDFCINYLERNANFIFSASASFKSLSELKRITQLILAKQPGSRNFRYHQIRQVVFEKSNSIIESAILLQGADENRSDYVVAVLKFYNACNRKSSHRVLLQKWLDQEFQAWVRGDRVEEFIQLWWDDALTATIVDLMGDRARTFYASLAENADTLPKFNALMTLDKALKIDGEDAVWRVKFEEHLVEYANPDPDPEGILELESMVSTLEDIASHLDFDAYYELNELNDHIARINAENSYEDNQLDASPTPKMLSAVSENAEIDAMFASMDHQLGGD